MLRKRVKMATEPQPGPSSISFPNYEIEATWDVLQRGLREMFLQRRRRPTTPPFSRIQFMELYTVVYDYCTDTRKEMVDDPNNPEKSRSAAQHQGWELYERLQEFLKAYVEKVMIEAEHLRGEDLLALYETQWKDYRHATQYLDGIFHYLNKHWVVREHEEGRNDIYEIYALAMVTWRDHLFKKLQTHLTTSVLNLIEKDRNHEMINSSLVSVTLESYAELGLSGTCRYCKCKLCNVTYSQLGMPGAIYQDHFENQFLEDTKRYYVNESEAFLRENTVTDYLINVDTRLKEEKLRRENYLQETTENALFQTCHSILIERYKETIQNEFRNLLELDKTEDIGRMYSLLLRVPNGLDGLPQQLEDHITEQGLCAIKVLGDENENDPNQYVDTILRVHKKYNALVLTKFTNDIRFAASLDKAFTKFVNKNSATKKITDPRQKTPELLAKYCDHLLKKSNKLADDLEDRLSQVMVIFKYIKDKDIFEKFYSNRLALRIVQQTSTSDDAEASMISKLKQACGCEYTNKLQLMFKDIGLSKDLNEQLKYYLENTNQSLNVDFQIQVLSSGAWPFKQVCTLSLPSDLERCVDRFQKFYALRHSGRKLIWLNAPQMSKGEVVTIGFQKKYTFDVSTIQMAILLHYNEEDEWSLGQLKESINTNNEDVLMHALRILITSKLLFVRENNASPKQSGSSASEEKGLTDTSVIALFKNYRNPRTRVRMNMPMKKQERNESEATHIDILENRKFEVEACIVRIMKSRKTLSHQLLVTEVLNQLASRFIPQVSDIKKRISGLIEKEYIERQEGTKDVYNYVA